MKWDNDLQACNASWVQSSHLGIQIATTYLNLCKKSENICDISKCKRECGGY